MREHAGRASHKRRPTTDRTEPNTETSPCNRQPPGRTHRRSERTTRALPPMCVTSPMAHARWPPCRRRGTHGVKAGATRSAARRAGEGARPRPPSVCAKRMVHGHYGGSRRAGPGGKDRLFRVVVLGAISLPAHGGGCVTPGGNLFFRAGTPRRSSEQPTKLTTKPGYRKVVG